MSIQSLSNNELLAITGGNCSWKGAGQSAVAGAVGGAFGGPKGVGAGALTGALGYGLTCWW